MEIKFQDKLKYQQDAINSAVNLFKGHPNPNGLSPISIRTPHIVDVIEGNANLLDMDPLSIEENFYEVQKNNNLPVNKSLKNLDFTVEMETGTGKTYVYLRTILELNKQYGFSKFVIVVPSVAIREGVKKTIDITRKHFSELYNGVSYSDFIFNSSNMSELETFMEEDNIQIMIITVQAFSSKKDTNKINRKMENGIIPIQYIQKTNPIVIIDEPQSTISTKDRKDAISNLNPLFTLQYSATPKDTTNLIYKLDAVDAYNKNLVKKIEVNAFDSADYQGKPYIRLNSVKLNKRSGKRTADITFVKNTGAGLNTVSKKVKAGDDLSVSKISNNPVYEDYIVKDIGVKEGEEFISFDNGQRISLNQAINDINQEAVRKSQLKETIREHLKKELKLSKRNIKVLSLFFIDNVENYRYYDEEGPHKGKYAEWFEKAYLEVLAEDDAYQSLPKYILDASPDEVHDGYFSIDRKKWTNTSGETTKDHDTYELIMKDKEKLLDPKNNLRFIFSHSALKEGWDNPNVFQICTFIETQSDMSKRQKIGRGLRLCVDGDGNRIDESYGNGDEYKTINRLTVLANESFDSFASSLQKEMEADGIEFHKINVNGFKGLSYIKSTGEHVEFDNYDSKKIWGVLHEQGFLDKKGVITKEWKSVVVNPDNLVLPEKYLEAKHRIIEFVSSKNGTIVENSKDRKTFKLRKNKLDEQEFNNLWDKINYKSNFTVDFDRDDLINDCVDDMRESLKHIQKTMISHTRTEVQIRTGVDGITKSKSSHFVETENTDIPNIVKDLQNSTHLDKQTIIDILIKSNDKFKSFEKLLINPTEFYNRTLEVIKNNLKHLMIKNIEYYKLEGQTFDASEYKDSFEDWVKNDNYLERRLVKSDKSVYEYIKCDSDIEVQFAQELENIDEIEFFLKLPNWFKIKTPGGKHYNPDWAITVNVNGKSETFFVIETKGTSNLSKLRPDEADNIKCGIKHFELESKVEYDYLKSFDEFARLYIHDK